MNELEIGIAVAFAAGVLSFLSPCVLPLVPSYLSFVSGVGLEDLEQGGGDVRRTAFIHSLFFVLGFSLVFLVLGASATFLGRMLREYQIWIARIGGFVIALFGLYLLGLRPGMFLQRERRVHLRNKPLGYLGSTLVGITFGAGWSPCIGPILGGILTFAATRQTMSEGLVLLGFYSAGLAVPFLVSSLALSWFLSTFDRFKKWIPWVERISGLLLLAVGLLLMSGRFTALAAWMTRFTPEFILERI
ncbi:MAG: cytochrome c biogenesis protein CcdA [marine benthic group bacterium]|nr:cytochrome c biogenesis protein CcdA [Gemmatimonadota bacterium]MCL7962688.1 cytochrome c biogenesis protein CcdA [Candidatus Carthagonibacter metallireducens]MCL7957229.1 cytochrome c biogenesis protein CcdA [Gemmatimonadota bacterium]MCL7964074.1 cytochrome c biogenesis protein CcdA [Gemmatimonadota bacterium]MCL7966974.1 cytochrome c biogenesis protein CcdA [Gemmatimonadota bacterium]